MRDPFAIDTDDTEDEKDTVTETNTNTETNTASGTEVSVTLKGGSGFDAPWVVLRAPSADEALEQLKKDNVLKELIDRASKVGAYFASLGGSSGGNGNVGGGSKPARQQAPNGETRECDHGEMRFMSGVSKKSGKPYKMFVCQSGDRDNECKPQFLN
jgi:hypothetical protein